MRPIGVTLVCLYQLLRGVIGSSWTFIVLYTGDQPIRRRASKQCRGTLDGTSATRPASLCRICFVHALAAMAFCAGETGASVDDLSFCLELALILPRHPCNWFACF